MPQLALLLTTVFWGATFPATKAVLDQVPPMSFLFARFLLGFLVVGLGLLVIGRRVMCDTSTLRVSLVATLWLFLGYALQTAGLQHTTASTSAFITTLYVVFVPLIMLRFSLRIWTAALVAVAGLWFLVKPTLTVNWGEVLTLGCALAFAAHIACLERYTRMTDPVSLFVWQFLFISAAFSPLMWLEHPTANTFSPTLVLLVALGVTSVLASGAFAVQLWAQRLLPAHHVAVLFSFEPVCAAWLAWYFLGESLDSIGFLGSALILLAVLIASVPGRGGRVRTVPQSVHAS